MKIKPLYLKVENKDYLDELKPYTHQLKVEKLIKNNNKSFGFNFSPTGSGKTFSWLKPAIEEGYGVVAVYPTNSLIEDQFETAKNFCKRYYPEKDVKITVLTRESVIQIKKKLKTKSNGKAVEKILNNLNEHNLKKGPSILLTNPDILLLILKGMYSSGQFMRGNLFSNNLLVVDEFHLADVKQRNDLIFMASYLMEEPYSKIENTLFLSATPNKEIINKLRNTISGDIEVFESKTFSSKFKESNCIMPEAELNLFVSELFKTSNHITENYLETVLEVCKDGRTVIMLDGLKEVDKIYNLLKSELPGKKVKRIDGFHRDKIEKKLSEFEVLVSNSAVEVGIDFEVKNIIFSGYSDARFMQRIGRLRKTSSDAENHIIALTDKNLINSIKTEKPIERKNLEALVRAKLGSNNRPESFTHTYSVMEWIHFYNKLRNELTSSEFKETEELITKLIKNLFSTDRKKITDRYLKKQAKKVVKIEGKAGPSSYLRDLETYRGDNFQALVYDKTENQIKTYNLNHLLRWGEVEFLKKEKLRDLIPDSKKDRFDNLSRYMNGYCLYEGSLEENYRNLWISPYSSNFFMSYLKKSNENPIIEPQNISGISFRTKPEISSIDNLNKYTKNKKMVVKALSGSKNDIRNIYGVSDYMMLYSIKTMNTLPKMVAAFGLDSFYLHRRVVDNQIQRTN
ncbi:type I-D CRISPR-associated helicase Cas3' [Methanonatronarchaeum sp. AMET-Sl]|uniref:type I-D CRISPR-associated helicase Cas3' n=1 Tax=Methanonatronarchaeum sp. AMET-Sl TaxID=3037654 RepID=UPI00244E3C8F|nr:type I-D CRISPR-associated helicase Cas3' [Methanonatronarchaeum sp. AMET-Sl]WGI17878.1 type I-D CRISPR-associated helicase Cas3' [Methanonatronarchaeum sp. AMET-Sl]